MDGEGKIKPALKIQCDVNKMIIILIYHTEIEICQRIWISISRITVCVNWEIAVVIGFHFVYSMFSINICVCMRLTAAQNDQIIR